MAHLKDVFQAPLERLGDPFHSPPPTHLTLTFSVLIKGFDFNQDILTFKIRARF